MELKSVPEPSVPLLPSITIKNLPTGGIELRWPDTIPSVLEQSTTLKENSWSLAPDQGAPVGNGEIGLTLVPAGKGQFFRLRFD